MSNSNDNYVFAVFFACGHCQVYLRQKIQQTSNFN